jgi:flavin reductase (DIM6/NTAB) family NADH-FMN oxidoreductase RutF
LISSISRRLFLKLSCFTAALALPFTGCKKHVQPVVSKIATPEGDLIRLGDNVGPILFGNPIILCGSVVKGKPNFNVLGNFGIVSVKKPRPVVFISTNEEHYTNIGIRENKEFSVCFPTENTLAKTDYCGVFSGHKVDKSGIFQVQYGSLKGAPLIKECNICFACQVTQQTKINGMDVFYGEIIEKFGNSACLAFEKPDPEKIKPVTFGPGNAYRAVGESIGTPWAEYRKMS